MAENNNTENSNIAKILQAIINGSSDYPDFKDNPPSRIALLLMLLGKDISDIKEIVENLPNPMVFKGTLGTGGDIESLPAPSEDNNGFTYIVITAGTYAQQAAKFGDLFTSTGTAWSYVPSGDDYVIDDRVISTVLTWSSDKINTEFNGVKVKSFTYYGNGQGTKEITFDTTPNIVFISAKYPTGNTNCIYIEPIQYGLMYFCYVRQTSTGTSFVSMIVKLSYNGNKMTIDGTGTSTPAIAAMNYTGTQYQVTYI